MHCEIDGPINPLYSLFPVKVPLNGDLTSSALYEDYVCTGSQVMKNTLMGILVMFGVMECVHAQYNQHWNRNKQAAEYCIKNGALLPNAFAECVVEWLTETEIDKCLNEGTCFDVNISHIMKHGICGGRGSTARDILGSKVCGEFNGCTGPEGWVHIINRTNKNLNLKTRGRCSGEEKLGLAPGESTLYGGVGSDDWIWIWSGGLTNPYKGTNGSAGKCTAFRVTNVGHANDGHAKGGRWRLLSGHTYAIEMIQDSAVPKHLKPWIGLKNVISSSRSTSQKIVINISVAWEHPYPTTDRECAKNQALAEAILEKCQHKTHCRETLNLGSMAGRPISQVEIGFHCRYRYESGGNVTYGESLDGLGGNPKFKVANNRIHINIKCS